MKAFSAACFSFSIKKYRLLLSHLDFLGQVSGEGIRPTNMNDEALAMTVIRENVKQARQFMGLAGYFSKFLLHSTNRTACITALMKQGVPFQ